MCLCESVLSSGSVCLWMFACLCVVMYCLSVHAYTVWVCVRACAEVNSSSPVCEGGCAGAKCPAAHRCLFTG